MGHKSKPAHKRNILVLLQAMLAAACSPQVGRDDHFTCAAMISAADHLVTTSQVAADDSIMRKGLMASMGHLNAWAIPKGLQESEAFDSVKKERERLLGNLTPKEIVARAKVCMEQMPNQ